MSTSGDAQNAVSSEQTPLIASSNDDEASAHVDSVDVEQGALESTADSDAKNDTKLEATGKKKSGGSPYSSNNNEIGGFTKGCNMFFNAITAISIVVLICMSISQIILLAKKDVPILQCLLRVYILTFCLIFILAELDWPPSIMKSLPTKNWMMRGWLYSFLGLVGMEEAFAVLVSNTSTTNNILASDLVSIFIQISSWGMVVIGVLYFVLGLLCMRGLREKVQNDYRAAKNRQFGRSGAEIERV